MKVKGFLVIIYYILLIALMLWILATTTGFKEYFIHKNEEFSSVDDFDEFKTEHKKKKKKRKFQYNTIPNLGVTLVDQNTTTDVETIDYPTFAELVITSEFIKTFKYALETSYEEKITRYTMILRGLKSNRPKSSGPNSVNSNQTRMDEQIQEVEEILKHLKTSTHKLSLDKIRNDFETIVNDDENGFASLIGRENVKDKLARSIFSFSRDPTSFINGFQNMSIYGNSGIGKTKLAKTIAYIYAKTGILARRKFRKVSAQEFSSPYIDEAPTLTQGVFFSTLEGVLFIDEAYDLTPKKNMFNNNSHKDSAITKLVELLDDYSGLSIVIVGGYKKLMEEDFMNSNEGMRRRFRINFDLKNYNAKQLTDILIHFMYEYSTSIKITPRDADIFYNIVEKLDQVKVFDKQAGDMQNLATYILETRNSSFKEWGKNEKDNYSIIVTGINEFLESKNKDCFIGRETTKT